MGHLFIPPAKTTLQSSKMAVQEEGEAVNAAKVLNDIVQVTREPPEGVKEATEAQGKRDIDLAQGRQPQEEEAGKMRRYATNEQYKVGREEEACLRQRIEQLERITNTMKAGSRVKFKHGLHSSGQKSARQKRAC